MLRKIPIQKLRKHWKISASFLLLPMLGWFVVPWLVPLPDGLEQAPASSVLYDRNGEPLHRLTLDDFTRSEPVSLDKLPQELIDATLATEDKRFRSHGGIDLLATARALRDWMRKGEVVSGASTITQQLIKLSGPPKRRGLKAKLYEALAARRLEMTWDKDRILEAYFNRLDYGNLRVGPAEAARFYFQKPLKQLSLGECTLLAGLPQAPSRLNPLKHPERALKRRDMVLDRLRAAEKYDARRIHAARDEALRLTPLEEPPLALWLPRMVDGTAKTTIDKSLQYSIEAIVSEEVEPLREANLRHMAVVVIDNASGQILALVSSADWNDPNGGQINGALSPRSPGSTLKPFTYLLAFQNGRHPGSIIADIPSSFRTREGLNAPENYDRRFRGPVTIRHALACSLNVPAMRELNRLGGPKPLVRLMDELRVHFENGEEMGLGLTIGNAPARLLDLTNAYATLARGGRYIAPSLDPDLQAKPVTVFGEKEAWLITDILSDTAARAPAFGRNNSLELPFPCAVKTGTSSDFHDNWCIGYTTHFTVGVWAGNFDHQPMSGITGVDGAGPVFNRTMQLLHRNEPPTPWIRPEGLIELRIDPRSGQRVHESADHSILEWIPIGSEPLFAAPDDYDNEGRLRLDSLYAEWLAGAEGRRRSDLVLRREFLTGSPLRILSPKKGAIYQLDPELPNGGWLHLETNIPGLAEWSCDTLALRDDKPEPVARLVPGVHLLTAKDPRNGVLQQVEVVVETR